MTDYRAQAQADAVAAGINPTYFTNQINAESGFNPTAHSGAGAQGIAQIMPATARSWGVNASNPSASLKAAASAMAHYLHSYNGDWRLALGAYNAGPGNAKNWNKIPETRNYVQKILGGASPQQGAGGLQSAMTPPAGDPVNATGSSDPIIASIFSNLNPTVASLLSAAPPPSPSTAVPGGVGAAPLPTGSGANKVLSVATAQVGKGIQQAAAFAKANGIPFNSAWCGNFVQSVFKNAGLPVPPAQYVPSLLASAQKNHTFTKTSAPGYLELNDWNGDGVPDHVGIVAQNGQEISGNTSGPHGGVGVWQKPRQASQILGYVNPYGSAA